MNAITLLRSAAAVRAARRRARAARAALNATPPGTGAVPRLYCAWAAAEDDVRAVAIRATALGVPASAMRLAGSIPLATMERWLAEAEATR